MRDSKNKNKLLSATKDFKGFREADEIISYLKGDDSESKLPAALQTKLDRYIIVNNLRLRYRSHNDIIRILYRLYDRNPRQARNDISETEYIFGQMIRIDRAYEKAFLLDAGRRNIKIAERSGDSSKISAAMKIYNDILGPEEDLSDIPDFSKFEQHNYNIVLPPGIADILTQLVSSGSIDLSKMVPSKLLMTSNNGA